MLRHGVECQQFRNRRAGSLHEVSMANTFQMLNYCYQTRHLLFVRILISFERKAAQVCPASGR